MSRACIVDTHPPPSSKEERLQTAHKMCCFKQIFFGRELECLLFAICATMVSLPSRHLLKEGVSLAIKRGRDKCLSHVWPIHPRLVGSQTAWPHTLFKGKSSEPPTPPLFHIEEKRVFMTLFPCVTLYGNPFNFFFFRWRQHWHVSRQLRNVKQACEEGKMPR